MDLFIIGHPFRFEIENATRLFIRDEKINIKFEWEESDNYIITSARICDDTACLEVKINRFGTTLSDSAEISVTQNYKDEGEYALAQLLYKMLISFTGENPKWGMLTGIRPTKLLRKYTESYGDTEGESLFKTRFFVSDEKFELCKEIKLREDKILSEVRPDGFSLYISVPFCPTRCLYCSFVSHSIERTKKLMKEYVLLCVKEIEKTAEITKKIGLTLRTVYFGGGTPTSLDAEDITLLMNAISDNFDMSKLSEYTVEAGRPDTITEEKLLAIKSGGATRISINTQTTDNAVLKAIGRQHTFEQFLEKWLLARKIGFDNINTDMIAGLPSDTLEGFKKSVDELLKLDPENLTVHTLAIKRSSTLGEHPLPHSSQVNDMLEYAEYRLKEQGLNPYYMYRQSNSASNLENVGYAKTGHEGIYNVCMMDEAETVIACGAGAVTKLKAPHGDEIERIFNYKYPYEYIERFDDILNRKEKVMDFYERFKI